MAFKAFRITVSGSEEYELELNTFLRTHRVLSVSREFIANGENSFWALLIDYLEGRSATTSNDGSGGNRNRVDYRQVLNADDFAVFARLRDLRKEIAKAESVPVYLVFTNEQLAQIVQQRVTTKAQLEKIDGIGDARVEKYGARIIEFLKQSGFNHAPSGQPV